MHRVMIIGPCGAGKSTASHRVSKALNLPLYHIDRMHWSKGWVEGSKSGLRDALALIVAKDRWVIDGNYGSSMGLRLTRADTVVYLDFPIWLCLLRAVKRAWRFHGRNRPDMADGCPERFDIEFFLYILRWNQKARPRTEALLKTTRTRILRFRNPTSLENWLTGLEKEYA